MGANLFPVISWGYSNNGQWGRTASNFDCWAWSLVNHKWQHAESQGTNAVLDSSKDHTLTVITWSYAFTSADEHKLTQHLARMYLLYSIRHWKLQLHYNWPVLQSAGLWFAFNVLHAYYQLHAELIFDYLKVHPLDTFFLSAVGKPKFSQLAGFA